MRFIPHTDGDVGTMLDAVGVASTDDLFTPVPPALLERASLALEPGLSEPAVRRRLEELAAANSGARRLSFLGAGAYPHFSPAVVDHVIQRAEFYSAYTPYQPEVSQGTLQAIFEFQTLIAMMLGFEVANASMYDGASATAEAVLMALRLRPRRHKVVISRAVHPQYAAVVRTYLQGLGEVQLVELPWAADGRVDGAALAAALDEQAAAVVVGQPNILGVLEDVAAIAATAAGAGAMTITASAEPLAFALVRPPGACGADIAVAEGQSFGLPLSYGGPGLGLFATQMAHVRSMPGRLIGETVDSSGRRAFVLTLATREQHIRREKATSNICTNHSLMALAATVYLTTLGRRGLRAVAAQNLAATARVAKRLADTGKWRRRFDAPVFNEVALQGRDVAGVVSRARAAGVQPGWELGRWFPDLEDCLLVCTTEVHTEADIDRLVQVLS